MYYSLVDDIGVKPFDASADAYNAQVMTSALNAMWSGGKHKFRDGSIRPVDRDLWAGNYSFFIKNKINTSRRTCGKLKGISGTHWPLNTNSYSPIEEKATGGLVSLFIKTDNTPLFGLRGTGFDVERITCYGRPFSLGSPEGPLTGIRSRICFEVESHEQPGTGLHNFDKCVVSDFDYGLVARNGYYTDSGIFVKEESHADNVLINRCLFHACGNIFRSECEQSVLWMLRDCVVSYFGGAGLRPCNFIDMVRGGNIWVDGLSFNHPQGTLFQFGDFAPSNTRLITFNNVKIDFGDGNIQKYIRLMKYVGSYKDPIALSSLRWAAKFQNIQIGSGCTDNERFDMPQAIPMKDIQYQLTEL